MGMQIAPLVVLVGDRDEQVEAHPRIEVALSALGLRHRWQPTDAIDGVADLADAQAVWVVPGSPYRSMPGALTAIRYAREAGLPYLGTCGGFQHALIEWARTVLGLAEADDAQSAPEAALQLITPLTCSLRGDRRPLRMRPGSMLSAIYGRNESEEIYHCCYGLNPEFADLFTGALEITAWDETGAPRAVELAGHPFFIGTLYQPELASDGHSQHVLIRAFAQAVNHQGPVAEATSAPISGSARFTVASRQD